MGWAPPARNPVAIERPEPQRIIPRFSDLRKVPPPPLRVGALGWRDGQVIGLTGAPAAGKSAVALAAACEVAAPSNGKTWCDKPIEHGDVLWVAPEGEHTIRPRMEAWAECNGVAAPPDNVGILPSMQVGKYGPGRIIKDGDMPVRELAEACEMDGLKPKLVILDTVAASLAGSGADENSQSGMGYVIQWAYFVERFLRFDDQYGPCVVLIHHTGKDEHRGPRGHSSFLAALDVETRAENSGRTVKVTARKNRSGFSGMSTEFDLRPGGPLDSAGKPLGVAAVPAFM